MSKKPSYKNDFFTKKALKEGIRARSYYKLEEIDHKFQIFSHLKGKDSVLDLGCFPGSWTQYVLQATGGKCHVVGVDLKETVDFPNFPGKFHFIMGDIGSISESSLLQANRNRDFSVVMSDMAPDTSGNPDRDAYLSYELVLLSWEIAKKSLISRDTSFGGVFIAKYFQGGENVELINQIRSEAKHLQSSFFRLGKVSLFKPISSRKNSREIYLIVK